MFRVTFLLLLAVSVIFPSVSHAGENKEPDAMLSYPFDTQESLKIGLALGEAAGAYLLSRGKATAVVNDDRINALVQASKDFDAAKKMVSVAERDQELARIGEELTKLQDQLRGFDAQTQAKQIEETSGAIKKLTGHRTAIEALQPVDDIAKSDALTAAKAALGKATREMTSNSDNLKATVKSSGRTVKTLKFLGRTFCLVDLGVKGYYWLVLDGDAGYSPAGEMVYHGVRRIYQKVEPALHRK